jgi:arylsulfatase A-like enzyme
LPRGKVVEARTRLLDLMPTLLDYLGNERRPHCLSR